MRSMPLDHGSNDTNIIAHRAPALSNSVSIKPCIRIVRIRKLVEFTGSDKLNKYDNRILNRVIAQELCVHGFHVLKIMTSEGPADL